MKGKIAYLFLTVFLFSFFTLFGCASSKKDSLSVNNRSEKRTAAVSDRPISESSRESEYSHKTVIVSLQPESPEGTARALADDFDLELIYDYKFINACALSARRELTDAELEDLIARLKKDVRVLNVEKDMIIRLTDPVRPRLEVE